MYSGFIAWCTLCWEGVTKTYSNQPIFPICLVWYQNWANSWIGAKIAITIWGTPSIAAGIRSKEKYPIKLDIGCLSAQARLNSSLLWWITCWFQNIFILWLRRWFQYPAKSSIKKATDQTTQVTLISVRAKCSKRKG